MAGVEKSQDFLPLIQYLVSLTKAVSQGDYSKADELFEFTKHGKYDPVVEVLAESFGLMMVQVEAREFNLERMIEELARKNEELEATLAKVRLLESVKSHLSKFVPESVKTIIDRNPDAPDLEKRDRDMSVLFLDIAGYTRMSEKVEQARLNYLIERYFSSFLDVILAHKGDINETAGDGLMIIFQDPDPVQHAQNAVDTAVGIQKRTAQINKDHEGQYQAVAVNVGINSGLAAVGSTRFEGVAGTRWTFTASGSMTNLAARIGKLAVNGAVLVGQETHERVKDRFAFEDFGLHSFKNVSRPMRVYQVVME